MIAIILMWNEYFVKASGSHFNKWQHSNGRIIFTIPLMWIFSLLYLNSWWPASDNQLSNNVRPALNTFLYASQSVGVRRSSREDLRASPLSKVRECRCVLVSKEDCSVVLDILWDSVSWWVNIMKNCILHE